MKRKWLTLALALALAVGLFGCDMEEKTDTPNATGGTDATSQATPTPEPAPTPEETKKEKDSYRVGEQAEQGDVAVTLTEVEESSGGDFFTPEEGKVFLICHFDIENNSDDDLSVSSILSFDAYVDDYSASISLSATASSSEAQLDGSVAAGKKMAGVIGYEVPEDWSTLEVTFKPNVWSGKSITFIAEKES